MTNKQIRAMMPGKLRSKLITATSLLLVSAIMMVTTTYAWLVMSTAPEVTGITTQVGANGSLEIVLLDTETFNNLALITDGDIDEGLQGELSILAKNLNWGNLVSLGDASYGLGAIKLMPSRLNIKEDGTDAYKILATLLKTPKYGEDGRVIGLNETAASAVYSSGNFPIDMGNQTYGVRAVGTASNQSKNQLNLNEARNKIVGNTAAARTAASTTLQETGGSLGNIVVKYALGSASTYTKADIQAMKDLAVGLQGSLASIEAALRNVFAAYIVSDKYTQPAGWNYDDAIAADAALTLSQLFDKYGNAGVPNLGTYITIYNNNKTKVDTAITQCATMLASGDSFTWDQIVSTMNPLVDYTKMELNGKTITEVKNMEMSDMVSLVAGGMTITVPSGSGIISDVADFAGNYTAKVTVENVSYGSFNGINVDVNMKTATEQNPVYLGVCSNLMAKMKAADAVAGNFITDFFGFVVDLAFRTNAADSNLLLQTEDANRIYAGSDENPALMGGGSYMEYTISGNLSATKMIQLMRSIRIVFMDKEQNVLCIAALDTTLGQEDYRLLTEEEKSALLNGTDKKYALQFKGASNYSPQRSDYITETEYNALPTNSEVEYSEEGEGAGITRKLKAQLYLYNFHLTTAGEGADAHLTGGLTIDEKRSDSVITPLVQDEAKAVSALVYMDGSFVNNSMVAANAEYSMTGTLNLQFASSATLIPAEIADLRKPEAQTSTNP